MDRFTKWFDTASGYALHRMQSKPLTGCCIENLRPEEKQIYLPAAKKPLPLFRCRICGRYYAPAPQGFYHIENLLRYRVETMHPQKK